MAHNHHNECAHTIKFCAHCDVTYCTKCSKEWGAPCGLVHYPWWNNTTITTPYTWTTSGTYSPSAGNATDVVVAVGHEHNN